jgi:hypothetical protein
VTPESISPVERVTSGATLESTNPVEPATLGPGLGWIPESISPVRRATSESILESTSRVRLATSGGTPASTSPVRPATSTGEVSAANDPARLHEAGYFPVAILNQSKKLAEPKLQKKPIAAAS